MIRSVEKADTTVKAHENHIEDGNRKGSIRMGNLGKIPDLQPALFVGLGSK
jgi:hypothetical protein